MIKSRATQEFVPIKEVRDGILVLKDGSLRGILLASSLNFALKSDDERQSILLQFQNFLNSLDFSVQIFIQSRKLDIRPYIALLEEQQKNQMNDLMKIQIQEYIGFIKNFTENTNIMSKNFFLVVPYAAALLGDRKDLANKILLRKNSLEKKLERAQESFEENKTQLRQRLAVVEQGMIRSGIRTVQLGNDEIIELFYKMFNPGETEKPIKLGRT